jgi:hydroxymethylbilane synthase
MAGGGDLSEGPGGPGERPLRLGTRGSELALWQARHVAARIAAFPGAPSSGIELVVLRTAGDRLVDVPLPAAGGKAFFTAEIEAALAAGEIDFAVHSLKDLATELPPALAIAAILERDDPRDALISARRDGVRADLERLPPGARVGTSSLRRKAQLARRRPGLVAEDLRGNVPTRLRKLDEGRFDAVVLAAAGLNRLGLGDRIDTLLAPDSFLPAPGQGALAVEIRADDEATRRLVEPLDDAATRAATTAERALLRRLEGGCQVPVGALAELRGGRLHLAAVVCSLDGKAVVEGHREGAPADAAALGEALAEELLENGARQILAAIRGRVPDRE